MISSGNLARNPVSRFLVLFHLLLFSFATSANSNSREFKGRLGVKLVLLDNSQYSHGLSFKTSDQLFRTAIIASSTSGKISDRYHFELKILNENNDRFDARVSIYENKSRSQSNLAQQQEILAYVFSGKLYQNNQFEFTTPDKPTLKINLFMDKIFTLEEIKNRFKKSSH